MRQETVERGPVEEKDEEVDVLGPSYPESAARFIGYRIGIVIIAGIVIFFGKSNWPEDGVRCLEDVVIDSLIPVTQYYLAHFDVGKIATALLQILVEGQLIAISLYWFVHGNDMVLPACLSLLGVTKILLTALFKIQMIKISFISPVFPSILLSPNLSSSYFFSASSSFLIICMLELRRTLKNNPNQYKRNLWKIEILVILFVSFCLLSMRLNFIIDICTGFVFGHLLYQNVEKRRQWMQDNVLALYDRITGQEGPENGQNDRELQEFK